MRHLGQLLLSVLVGLGLAAVLPFDVDILPHTPAYQYAAYTLLTIGLYGATFGIDVRQARRDKKIIGSAVTIGVILKAAIVGGVLALAWQNPLFLVLGVVVAQIDPLSAVALLHAKRMSARARNILLAWSSFDDPCTVILSIYVSAVVGTSLGVHNQPSDMNAVLTYVLDFGSNLLFASAAWLLWRLIGERLWFQYCSLAAFLVVSVSCGWILAIAIIGLFARPTGFSQLIPRITQCALHLATVALGVLLFEGVSVWAGVTLAVAVFIAQALVAGLLTHGMSRTDRWYLAIAQQSGITAVILALTLEIQFDGIVAIVAPAIIAVNVIHVAANAIMDRRLAGTTRDQF